MTRKPGSLTARKSPQMAPLTMRILTVLKRIPKGKVASYGQVAALAGSPRGARQVVRILHTLSEKEKLPWHRVVDRNGRISLPLDAGGARQAALLRKERVEVSEKGEVDLQRFGWQADASKRVRPAGRSGPAS